MAGEQFYTILAKYYDKIYHFIDYPKQAEFFVKLINKYSKTAPQTILDVCCGTGTHLKLLSEQGFTVTGCDISKEMLKQARQKYPDIRFIQCDMRKLDLSERFDVLICFFNSILYNNTPEQLYKTSNNFYKHLNKGGVVIFDMVDKEIGVNSEKDMYIYEEEGLKITFAPQWVYNSTKNSIMMDLNVWFTLEKNGQKEDLFDHHKMGAFSFDEVESILQKVGFEVFILEHDFDNIKAYRSERKRVTFVAHRGL